MNDPKFVHLHTHSHYSLLDGLSQIPDLVKKAKEYGMPAIALTDHGAMYGAIEFYRECKKEGINPIIGVEAYIAERTRHDKDVELDKKRYHLTLLAKNNTGYKNLMKLVSLSYLEGYYYKPRMDEEILRRHADGVICLSGCPAGELAHALRAKNEKKAKEIVDKYISIFGKDNFFLELMNHEEVEGFKVVSEGVKKLSKEYGVPIVATWDSHYLHEKDKDAHNTLLAVNTGGRDLQLSGDYHFINPKEALEYFKDIPEALENTVKVAEMVNIEIDLDTWKFPEIEIPEGETYDSYLKKLTYERLAQKGIEKTKEVEDRIEYELGVIKQKGYSSYFLVVADLIDFSKENEIYTNTRGSAAGSMVSYAMGVTNVNPLVYNLPFERFLNPERPSLPDIDMDFADDRRDEVIEYAKRKYGEHAVAQIGTFGTMLARGAVRDVARALDFPYDTGDRISKMIPLGKQGFPMTIDKALDIVPELKEAYDTEKDTREIIDMARKLEGSARHISVHAAGVVISPGRVDDYSPVQFDPKGGKVITQYDMYTGKGEGVVNLPKFDFLGIRNLSILGNSIKIVEKIYGEKIDIENISVEDKETFKMLTRGETMGVFQLSSAGMTRYIKELGPTNIEDLIAMVSLYRPGPMQFIPDFIQRKYNPHLIKYVDPRLEEILKPTYGILIYQDDILRIANKFAGYTMGEADKFRKAVGKKIPEEMAKQKDKFINGCIEHGMKPGVAKELWDMIETFAAYGFNKAHAASYAQLAYRTAYMKAHYPTPYMTAILTAESGDTDKVSDIISECKKMGISVLEPDINECFGGFTVIQNESKELDDIRFGFYTIKNLGKDISDAIIEERKKRGSFVSIEDFLERVQHKNLNKKSMEALIKSGCFDKFEDRGVLLENMEEMLEFNRSFGKVNLNQISLFGGDEAPKAKLKLKEAKSATKEDKLSWEKELLGLYLSGHPLEKVKDKIEKNGIDFKKIHENGHNNTNIVAAAIIDEVKKIITKKGQQMAFLKLSDLSSSIEAAVFPNTLEKFKEFIEENKTIAFKAKVTNRNGEKSLILESIKSI